MDLIRRQQAIDALMAAIDDVGILDGADIKAVFDNLPPAQPEPSIPLSWIEKYIEWLKSFGNEFANLEAAHISVMVKKWRDEQDETD